MLREMREGDYSTGEAWGRHMITHLCDTDGQQGVGPPHEDSGEHSARVGSWNRCEPHTFLEVPHVQ